MEHKLKLAVIGGGAVAERVHLPALEASSLVDTTMLVEHSPERARDMAARFKVPRITSNYLDVIGQVDAAIIGLPHHLHAQVAIELMNAGIHVLVEKPMALKPDECDRMNEAAARNRCVLAVGLLRRGAPSLRWIKNAIDTGMLGRIQTFDIREGGVYGWPVASPSMFRPEGGGVLADAGAHVLDLLLWWFGDWASFRYLDDAEGGVEADCLLEIEMSCGARGRVELSRTRPMPNTCVITGERGTIEVGTKTDSIVTASWFDGVSISSRATAGGRPSPTNLVDLFMPQFEQFVRAIRDGEPPGVSGLEGRRSIDLLAACYAARERWSHPWDAGNDDEGYSPSFEAEVA